MFAAWKADIFISKTSHFLTLQYNSTKSRCQYFFVKLLFNDNFRYIFADSGAKNKWFSYKNSTIAFISSFASVSAIKSWRLLFSCSKQVFIVANAL